MYRRHGRKSGGSATRTAHSRTASGLPPVHFMHLLLLAAFPVLLLYRPRYAFVAIALAIVLLYRQRVNTAQRRVRRKYDDD
jgi:hypothetical protein